jgi:spermidine synthase
VLRELAKYPLQQIDYAELDPLLIEAVQGFPTPLTQEELGNPRLTIEHLDGRLLVRERQQAVAADPETRYDLIIVNLPYPSTLQLNRYYTLEFYQMIEQLLSRDGVVVVSTPGTLSYMSSELRDLNASVYHTLREALPYVRPIPGDLTLWIASPSQLLLDLSIEELSQRWEERKLDTLLLTAQHIRLRLDQRYVDWFWASLSGGEGVPGGERILLTRGYLNRDLHPVGLFYGLSYWNALFSPLVARALAMAGRMSLWVFILPIVGAALVCFMVIRLTGKGRGGVVPVAIAATGFAGMAADLIIIFAFQSLYGHVYYWVGLLITSFMAGLSLGGLLMTRRLSASRPVRTTMLRLEVALFLFWILLPAALGTLYSQVQDLGGSTLAQAVLFLLNALAGFLVGAQFPLANRLWLAGGESGSGTTGSLYACDLAGAFVGAVLVSVILIPILGIPATCLVAAVLKLSTFLLLLALPSSA